MFPERKKPQVAEYSIRKVYGQLLDMLEKAFSRSKPLFSLTFYYPIQYYIGDDEELVEQPFFRLIEKKKLAAFPHSGYWQAMDTFKDKINFDRAYARGDTPWQVWKN